MGYQVLQLNDQGLYGYNPGMRHNLAPAARLAAGIADVVKHNREVKKEKERRGFYRSAIQQELGLDDKYPVPEGAEADLMGDVIKSKIAIAQEGAKKLSKVPGYNDEFRLDFRKMAETMRVIKDAKRYGDLPAAIQKNLIGIHRPEDIISVNEKQKARSTAKEFLRDRYPDKARSIFFFDIDRMKTLVQLSTRRPQQDDDFDDRLNAAVSSALGAPGAAPVVKTPLYAMGARQSPEEDDFESRLNAAIAAALRPNEPEAASVKSPGILQNLSSALSKVNLPEMVKPIVETARKPIDLMMPTVSREIGIAKDAAEMIAEQGFAQPGSDILAGLGQVQAAALEPVVNAYEFYKNKILGHPAFAPQEKQTYLSKLLDATRNYVSQKQHEGIPPQDAVGRFNKAVFTGLGSAAGQIPLFAFGSKIPVIGPQAGMGVVSAVQASPQGGQEMARAGIQGAFMQQYLKATSLLPREIQAPVMASLFGGQAAIEGKPAENVAADALLGIGLSFLSRAPSMKELRAEKVRQQMENARENLRQQVAARKAENFQQWKAQAESVLKQYPSFGSIIDEVQAFAKERNIPMSRGQAVGIAQQIRAQWSRQAAGATAARAPTGTILTPREMLGGSADIIERNLQKPPAETTPKPPAEEVPQQFVSPLARNTLDFLAKYIPAAEVAKMPPMQRLRLANDANLLRDYVLQRQAGAEVPAPASINPPSTMPLQAQPPAKPVSPPAGQIPPQQEPDATAEIVPQDVTQQLGNTGRALWQGNSQVVPIVDLSRQPTGWTGMKTDDGMIISDGQRFIKFESPNPTSGTAVYRARALAQSFAIDNAFSPEVPIKTPEAVQAPPVSSGAPSAFKGESSFSGSGGSVSAFPKSNAQNQEGAEQPTAVSNIPTMVMDGVAIVADIGNVSNNERAHRLVIAQPLRAVQNLFDDSVSYPQALEIGKKYYDEQSKIPVIAPAFSNTAVVFDNAGWEHITSEQRSGGRTLSADDVTRRLKLLPKSRAILNETKFIENRASGVNGVTYSLIGGFDDGSVVRVIVQQVETGGKRFFSVFDVENIGKKIRASTVLESSRGGTGHGVSTAPSISTKKTVALSEENVKGNFGSGGTSSAFAKANADNQATAEQPTSVPPSQSETAQPPPPHKEPLPMEPPELLELAQSILGDKIRMAKMRSALGRFYHSGEIRLSAEVFKDPKLFAKVLGHELGHAIDWADEKDLARGNILGRIASLHKYLKSMLPEYPGAPGILTEADRERLMAEARNQVREESQKSAYEIIEEIVKEVPIYSESGLTADVIMSVWKDTENVMRTKYPDLYDYLARADSVIKKEIVKQALKGLVDPRLPQGKTIIGTRQEKTTQKRTITPQPYTAAAVQDRFGKLLRQEIIKRRLFEREQIHRELKALTQKWNPFDESRVSPEYRKYRYSSKELYADALSVLLTNPEVLEDTAPTFKRAFFNWLAQKPDVQKTYTDIVDRLYAGSDAVGAARMERMKAGFSRGEAKWRESRTAKAPFEKSLAFHLKAELVDKNQALIEAMNKAIKAGKLAREENPVYQLEEHNYLSGKIHNLIDDIQAQVMDPLVAQGLTEVDLGQLLALRRMAIERKDIANPWGYTVKTAQDQIDYLSRSMPANKFKVLEQVEKEFRSIIRQVLDQSEAAGIISKETYDELSKNQGYSTFAVVDYLDDYISPEIIHQVGTLKEIANPFTATVMKLMSTKRLIERVKSNNAIIEALKKYDPDDILPAEAIYSPYGPARFRQKDGWGIIKTRADGKTIGYYIDPYIAETTVAQAPRLVNGLVKSLQFLNSHYFRPVYVSWNVGFQSFNLMRDFMRAWKLNPNIKTLAESMQWYARAHKHAASRIWGKHPDAVIREMNERGMLSLTYNDVLKEQTGEETHYEALAHKFDVSQTAPKSALKQVLSFWESLGDYIETLPKVAGYLSRQGTAPIGHIAHEVRTKAGSPDFLSKGTGYAVTNNVFLFSNAIIQGMRGDIEGGFADPKTRSGYWWKTFQVNILPKILMALAAAGVFGAQMQKVFHKASEYDKTNYTLIPYGIGEDGKALYIRIPQDEAGRLVGGIFWKLFSREKGESVFKRVRDVADIMGGQVPSVSPVLDLLSVWGQYFAQQNPYNAFTGRNVMTDDEYAAQKEYPLIGIKAMLKYTGEKMGIYGLTAHNIRADGSVWEKVLRFSPIVQRWVRYTDTGETEEIKDIVGKETAEQAKQRLELKASFPEYYSLKYQVQRKSQAAKIAPDKVEHRAELARQKAYVSRIEQLMKVYRKLPDGERKEQMKTQIDELVSRLQEKREAVK